MQSSHIARSQSYFKWKKPLLFGLWSALGALLCALLGELWLAFTVAPPPPPPPPPPAPPPQAIVLVLDTSGSMTGEPFDEMKAAALEYIKRQDYTRTRIGIVSFNSESRLISDLSRDPFALENAINSLSVDGMTRMDLGLGSAQSIIPPAAAPQGVTSTAGTEPERRSILLFTDGYPEDFDPSVNATELTRSVARGIRQSGCRLVAVGSGGADTNFLGELTGDPKLVFFASDGEFGEAFKQAEIAINAPTGKALLQSGKIDNFDAQRELWRIAVWTGLLGLGISTALTLSQSFYSRRKLGLRESIGILAGLIAGLLAGALGQWLFAQAGDAAFATTLGRLLAWAFCGGLIGWGISLFIPNLQGVRALFGGALGGWAGAVGFILISHAASDLVGRLMGATVIGFAIGLMVVLAEVVFRQAWLHVSYGPKDAFDLSLGAESIAVGSDRTQCRIFARESPAVAATYSFENGNATVIDYQGTRHNLEMGDRRRFGNVEITLCNAKTDVPVRDDFVPPLTDSGGLIPKAQKMASTPNVAQPAYEMTPTVSPVPQTSAYKTQPLGAKAFGWALQGEQLHVLPERSPVTLGRGTPNDVVIADAGISSSHARITVGKSLLTVTDLGSTNGTFINGVRLKPQEAAPLREGDRLMLGKREYAVVRT